MLNIYIDAGAVKVPQSFSRRGAEILTKCSTTTPPIHPTTFTFSLENWKEAVSPGLILDLCMLH